MSPGPWHDNAADPPDDDLLEDWEGPQAPDLDHGSDDDAVLPCPHCGREISELTQQCPHCGDWIVSDARTSSRRTPLAIAITILLLILLVLWAFL